MSLPTSERTPPRGILVLAIILIAFALIALYANVQKFRRNKIEAVRTALIVTPTPLPSVP